MFVAYKPLVSRYVRLCDELLVAEIERPPVHEINHVDVHVNVVSVALWSELFAPDCHMIRMFFGARRLPLRVTTSNNHTIRTVYPMLVH